MMLISFTNRRVVRVAIALTALFVTSGLYGQVLFIDDDARPGGDGLSWKTALTDLQDALDLASVAKGDISEIWVAAGVYHPDRRTGDQALSFMLQTGLAIYGGFVGDEETLEDRDPVANETILSADLLGNDLPKAPIDDPSVADNSIHIVVANAVDETAVLDGFTLLGGTAVGVGFDVTGGAMLIDEACPTVRNCRIIDCKAFNDGGAVRIEGNFITPLFVNCEFLRSTCGGRGGAVHGAAIYENCSFIESSAPQDGGAVYGEGAFTGCSFTANFALDGGSAVHTERPTSFIDCSFIGNVSGEAGRDNVNGGAIRSDEELTLVNCLFEANIAHRSVGGALSRTGNGSLTVIGCQFIANWAEFAGGAIFTSAFDQKLITNCQFVANAAEEDGGALHSMAGNLVVTRCTFRDNMADLHGGAVSLGYSDIDLPATFIQCEFSHNQTSQAGGAIAAYEISTELYNCIFLENSAAIDGGALWNDDQNSGSAIATEMLVSNCVLAGNMAANNGGAIANTNLIPVIEIVNTVIYANEAGNNGGGLYNVDGGTATLSNSILWNNSDAIHGQSELAQIFSERGAVLSVDYSCIKNLTGGFGGIGNIADNPLFVDPFGVDRMPGTEDDDLRLQGGSPCIDAGDNSPLSTCLLDLDGNLRQFDDPNMRDMGFGDPPIVDMGAYEFTSREGLDCNGNGLDDVCEIEAGFALDCNGNGEPDACDLENGVSIDCNENDIPDECDIAEGGSADCNGNGIPDECDISSGVSLDCNANGVPDECDISNGFSVDCNLNGVPDECDLANGEADCNQNQILDSCELADANADDCNRNGIPDECDLAQEFVFDSGVLSPFHEFFWQSTEISPAPPALSDVILTISAVADTGQDSEWVDVLLNGVPIGSLFEDTNDDCPDPPDEESLTVAAELFNSLVDGAALIELIPTDAVDDGPCNGGYIRVVVVYEREPDSADADADGIPDECEVFADLDNDGIVGATDLIILLGTWGLCPPPPDFCPADLSNDGVVGTTDLLILLGNWS